MYRGFILPLSLLIIFIYFFTSVPKIFATCCNYPNQNVLWDQPYWPGGLLWIGDYDSNYKEINDHTWFIKDGALYNAIHNSSSNYLVDSHMSSVNDQCMIVKTTNGAFHGNQTIKFALRYSDNHPFYTATVDYYDYNYNWYLSFFNGSNGTTDNKGLVLSNYPYGGMFYGSRHVVTFQACAIGNILTVMLDGKELGTTSFSGVDSGLIGIYISPQDPRSQSFTPLHNVGRLQINKIKSSSGDFLNTQDTSQNPTPPRQVVFVHGLNTSFRKFQSGEAGFQSLINAVPQNSKHFFSYYQDLGYKLPDDSCEPQPTPNTNTGLLYAHSDSINPSLCDSQSSIAYNAAGFDDYLTMVSSPAAIINYSMGAPITRGWLTLAQSKINDPSLDIVDTIISVQGVQQGSYLATGGSYLLDSPRWLAPFRSAVFSAANSLWGVDYNRPAAQDLAPQSEWYQSANLTNVPSKMHYINFYSDIGATIHPQFFFVKLPSIGSTSFGDIVILPGDPNPIILSKFGGARFLPNGSPKTDQYEYRLASNHDLLLGDDIMINLLGNSPAVSAILNDPLAHLNLNNHLNDNSVLINSCKGVIGQKTVQEEILRILDNPANACD